MLPKGLGGLGDFANMMKNLNEVRNNMDEIKEELASKTVEGSSGGGMVTVIMNGKLEMISINIDPNIIDAGDQPMVETLIVAAVNDGINKAQNLLKDKMQDLTGGMDIPGLTS